MSETKEQILVDHMDSIGYGRTMQLAQQAWGEKLEHQGLAGGEFAIGPCVVFTVPCGCEDGKCDWCCGSGWLTKHVKEAKEASE